jgi:hypothetical protein
LLIQQLKERLVGAGMRIEARDEYLCVPAKDATGFDVWVREDDWKKWTIGFARWSEVHDDPTSVLATLALGLSKGCRLEVTSQAGRDFRWTLEIKRGELWVPGSSFEDKAFHILPFKRKRYLQNDWMHEEATVSNIEDH